VSKLQVKNVVSKLLAGQPHLITGVTLALVLAVAYGCAQLTWRLLPAPEPLPLPPATVSSTPKQNQTPASQTNTASQQLPQWHLFGQIQKVTKEVPKQEVIPETKLNLTLRGLLASDTPEEGGAIIAAPSGKEQFYRVGASLPGGATLSEIHADRIVLEHRGRFETLRLPKESLNLSGPTSSNIINSTPRTQMYSGPGSFNSNTPTLASYRETLMQDPQKITDLVNIAPVRKRGKFVGYSLRPGKNPDAMAQYGLQAGDIVTSINGVTLDSPTKGFGVMRDLATASTIDLEIERGGRRQYISVPVQ